MRALCLIALCLSLTSCFRIRETQMVKMVVIPLPEKPELTRDPQADVQLLGAHALHLRQLIHVYNQQAEAHNAKHGL